MKSLKGRTVLLSGAASGIGRRLARDLFRQEGADLVLLDRDYRSLEVLKDELAPEPGQSRVSIHRFDISEPASVAQFMAESADRPADVLVNNAGIAYLGLFEKMELSDFEEVVGVNLLGTARLTKTVLPRLLQSPRPFIVNVSSLAGLVGAPGLCAYAASKAGIIGFSRALAIELEGRVGVCAVCPSFVKTGIAEHALLPEEDGRRAGRVGALNAVLAAMGSDPRRVSRAVIRSIKKGRSFALVNPDAYFLYYLDRFFPGLARAAVSLAYRQMARLGVLEA